MELSLTTKYANLGNGSVSSRKNQDWRVSRLSTVCKTYGDNDPVRWEEFGGIWRNLDESGGICERKTLFQMKKEEDQAGFKST